MSQADDDAPQPQPTPDTTMTQSNATGDDGIEKEDKRAKRRSKPKDKSKASLNWGPQDELLNVAPALRKRVSESSKRGRQAEESRHLTSDADLLHTDTSSVLQPESELEQTYNFKQLQLRPAIDSATLAKAKFKLDFGSSAALAPYCRAAYSSNGKSVLLASRKGHVSLIDWKKLSVSCEVYLNESVRDVTFVYDRSAFFAAAQKQHTYIYDSAGLQLHTLDKRHFREIGHLLNLPHHLLLAGVSHATAPHSTLAYTDVTTGHIVATASYASRERNLSSAVFSADLNERNGVVCLAHSSGAVSMWSPNVGVPLARVFAHPGGVKHVKVLTGGLDILTVGQDRMAKITDLRTFQTKLSWRLPQIPTAIAISQRNVIATSFGSCVQTYLDPSSSASSSSSVVTPYMTERFSGRRVTDLAFCPFEDVLSVAYETGMFSMLVPGSGEASFDARAANPYDTRKQRRETEVHMLLDKLPMSTIVLDETVVGNVEQNPKDRLDEIHKKQRAANASALRHKAKAPKHKARGRSKISKKLSKRQANVIDARKLELEEQLKQEQETKAMAQNIKEADQKGVTEGSKEGPVETKVPAALNRFFK